MFQLFIADCKGSCLKWLPRCLLYKAKVFIRLLQACEDGDAEDLLILHSLDEDLGQQESQSRMVYIHK